MKRFYLFKVFLAILIIIAFSANVHAQSRIGISLGAGKSYLMPEKGNFKTDNSSSTGYDAELEFFIKKNFSFFVNSGLYSFKQKNGNYSIETQLVPILNGFRFHIGPTYLGYALGFLIFKQKMKSDMYSFGNIEQYNQTMYQPGHVFISGMRFNLSDRTSLHIYVKYGLFKDNINYWLWGIGLGPSH